jgi:hypothetical protein
MATSGTSAFSMDVDAVCEEAFERIGVLQPTGADLRSARRSLNLMLQEMANRGEMLWASETYPIAVTTGTTTVTLPSDTLSVSDVSIARTGTTDSDLPMTGLGISDYRLIPNKTQTGRPLSWVLNRERDTPTLTLWPATDAAYTLTVERRRRLQDVTLYTETLDLPMRFLPAVVAGLAWNLAEKRFATVPLERRQELMARWEIELDRAMTEDRERLSLFVVPDLGP